MAGGHQPGRGVYGQMVARALQYVISCDDGKGYLISRQGSFHGPMYGHGFGTLFLAEAHGMVHDRELHQQLRDTVKRAVKLIVDSQNPEGGWRYHPESRDADVSVTICQIMALRAARNAGFAVPKATVDRCTEYVKKCQNSDGGFPLTRGGQSRRRMRHAAQRDLVAHAIIDGDQDQQQHHHGARRHERFAERLRLRLDQSGKRSKK